MQVLVKLHMEKKLYCLLVCENGITCLSFAGPTCKTSRRLLRICIMRTSAQRGWRERAGEIQICIAFTWAASVLGNIINYNQFIITIIIIIIIITFFCRAVEEDVMDKDQILLQKEAEVRRYGALALTCNCFTVCWPWCRSVKQYFSPYFISIVRYKWYKWAIIPFFHSV